MWITHIWRIGNTGPTLRQTLPFVGMIYFTWDTWLLGIPLPLSAYFLSFHRDNFFPRGPLGEYSSNARRFNRIERDRERERDCVKERERERERENCVREKETRLKPYIANESVLRWYVTAKVTYVIYYNHSKNLKEPCIANKFYELNMYLKWKLFLFLHSLSKSPVRE